MVIVSLVVSVICLIFFIIIVSNGNWRDNRVNDLEQSLYDKVETLNREIFDMTKGLSGRMKISEDSFFRNTKDIAASVYDARKEKEAEESALAEFKLTLKKLKGKLVGVRASESDSFIDELKVVDVLDNGEYIQLSGGKTYSAAKFKKLFVCVCKDKTNK